MRKRNPSVWAAVEKEILDVGSPEWRAGSRMVEILRAGAPNGFEPRQVNETRKTMTRSAREELQELLSEHPQALRFKDIDGCGPLGWLSRRHEPELIRAMIEAGSPWRIGRHPFESACSRVGAEHISGPALRELIEAFGLEEPVERPGVEGAGATPLWAAAMATNIEAMRNLLDWGANPRAINARGQTTLHAICSFRKDPERAWIGARMLLEAAPDLIEQKDHAGATPKEQARLTHNPCEAALEALEEGQELLAQASLAKSSASKWRPL